MTASIARSWAFDVLSTDHNIRSVVQNRILSASVIGVGPDPATPQTPFIMLRAEPSVPTIGGATRNTFTIYAHDEQGSYINNIDKLLHSIKEAFDKRSPDAWQRHRIYAGEWTGDSSDLFDDMMKTAVRYATIDIIVSRRIAD